MVKSKIKNIDKFSLSVTADLLEKDRREKELEDKIALIVVASWFILPIVGLVFGLLVVYVINP